MKRRLQKHLALILSLCMCLSVCPFTVAAEDTTTNLKIEAVTATAQPLDSTAHDPVTLTTASVIPRDCNFYVVAVPTPVDENHNPDLTPLYGASETVGKVISRGDIVVYESTVYPGVTEDECLPVVEKVSGLKFNVDFYAGYSPERINPGDKVHTVEKIKKVVDWFSENPQNNRIFTYHNPTQNKDVYMIALRNENGELIGYYEKHEYRNAETANLYDFLKKHQSP